MMVLPARRRVSDRSLPVAGASSPFREQADNQQRSPRSAKSSKLIANIARAAGYPDINISKNGLRELAARGVLQEGLAAGALALFAERNSFRSREAPISATEHSQYLTRAQELAVKLAALLPTAEAPSGAAQTGATRH